MEETSPGHDDRSDNRPKTASCIFWIKAFRWHATIRAEVGADFWTISAAPDMPESLAKDEHD
jgi:hypothetical protein